ncbi:DUF4124 domain-containing protein [Pseudoduganella violaceinigra]|uniref:DUF4124 domain-containing protein n=1 Tax=Pseudoduganella violaceinigra TaxID=246602 RepID=UPI00040BE23B|nr:DUF4124 domain-containing protein [Pseudoduganella violaceinigra]
MKKALLFTVLGMIAASQAGAQGLFKCKVDGKITYQSMACAKGGETIDVPPPPTPAQTKAAQARAQEDLERVKQLAESNRIARENKAKADKEAEAKEAGDSKRLAKPDCDKLRSRREDLYGRRNENRRNSQLEAMGKTQDEIDKLESEFTKAACGPLD